MTTYQGMCTAREGDKKRIKMKKRRGSKREVKKKMRLGEVR